MSSRKRGINAVKDGAGDDNDDGKLNATPPLVAFLYDTIDIALI